MFGYLESLDVNCAFHLAMAGRRGYLGAMTKNTKKPSEAPPEAGLAFEAALDELEALVHKMESGELSLEDSLAAFERGVKLTRHCQAALKSAELKVKVLTENAGSDLEVLELDDIAELDDD